MGTLMNQPPRRRNGCDDFRNEGDYIDDVKHYAKRSGLSVAEVTEILKLREMERANNLAVADGDIKDEQLAGFGELLTILSAELGGVNGVR